MASRLDSICQVLEYIETHLRAQITVADMADHCGYSLFHFIRLFNQFASQTPYDYLIRRRLSEARKDLYVTDHSITTLAYDYCFETPESFSRAFRRVFGLLPSVFRTGHPLSACLPIPPKIRIDLEFIQQGGYVPPQIVSIEEIQITSVPVSIGNQEQFDLDMQIDSLKKFLPPRRLNNNDRYFSVISFNEDPFSPLYHFFGVALESLNYPPSVSVQHIPSGNYVRFSYHQSNRQSALRYIFYTWLPQARLSLSDRFLVEEYPINQCQNSHSSILIPVKSN